MDEHAIFYYPYASFTADQAPLLKAAALYFDRLYILDPLKAHWDGIGPLESEGDVRLLEQAGILKRIAPEEVLHRHEQAIAAAIRADLEDPEFVRLCEERGRGRTWTIALAKVPLSLREDPRFQPIDSAMQRFMRQELTGLGYHEHYDEYRESDTGVIEYRYADYPLALGEAVMINHALFGGLVYSGATPLTDDPFHSAVLNLKIERAKRVPEVREVVESLARKRQLKRNYLAMATLTDLDLGVIPADLPLERLLEYRERHGAELAHARERLGWLAREIREVPWSDEFAEAVDVTIPKIRQELTPAKASWTLWLKMAGLAAGGAATVISLVASASPLLPVAAAVTALGLAKDVVLPGAELILNWREGRPGGGENGLHYLLKVKQA